ncbi:MAG: TonB-dependent receptor [Rhizobiales bacterium]|nr:TonB-dependent receptor [Rhizobacter sp.]
MTRVVGGAHAGRAAAATPPHAPSPQTPIVVTGSREPQPLDRVTADVVVIDAERIRASSADSVEDLLRREAGLQVSRNGAPGHAASVFIRGAGSGNTVVLVDGVRIGSGTLGQVEFESLGLSQIDRIEVLRGPGSSLYGADAVGGVIQIFTKRGEGAPRLSANAAAGGERSYDAGLAVSGASSGFDYAASLGREKSRGVSTLKPNDQFGNYNPDDDGFERDTGQFKLGFTPAAGHRVGLNVVQSRLNAQYDSSEFGPPAFAQDPSPDFRNKLETSVISLDYRGAITPNWTTSVQLAHNDDDLKSDGTSLNRFRTRREQATWQNAWRYDPANHFVFAYEHLGEKADSASFTTQEKRNNNAFVLGYTGEFGRHVAQADVRRDENSAYGGETTGRLGWSTEVAKGLRVRALAGTTFRAPSFNELYFRGYGVPSTTPERGRSVELGLNWRAGDSEAAATVYRNRVRDLIAYESDASFCPPDPSYAFGCARNIGSARLQGATFSGAQRFGNWRINGTIDFLDAKDLATGQRLARRAAHQGSLAVDHEAGAWRFGGALLAVGARPDGGVTLGGYATLDLSARWRFAPQWQLEAKLLNATDRQYEPARDYQPVGRQAWIGVRFDSKGI